MADVIHELIATEAARNKLERAASQPPKPSSYHAIATPLCGIAATRATVESVGYSSAAPTAVEHSR